ncbi:zinc metalloprotease HtpX [Breoghania sp. L-A4]|uniref:zinc metalloprotease HtpX n=1 Tax=Breoghania sp. L-A4 TaxID=2304600 RepID=UPI00196832C7|nr:zinc metalloprotease HtpX [Breoghania sp. L-A4]
MIQTETQAGLHRRRKLMNTLHTWLLAGGSLMLLALCAWALAGPQGVVWVSLGGALSLYLATHMSPKMVLRLYRARPLPETVFVDGHRVVNILARRAALPAVPELYVVPSRMMNAFAVGNRESPVICVTDGLLRGLTLREFAGVIAHEMSHIANGDIRVMALADVVSRMTSTMSTLGILLVLFNLPALIQGNGVPWVGIGLLMVAPTIGGLLQLALSRTREYDADLDAVLLTGDPKGLAGALVKLERAEGRMWEAMALPGGRLPDPSLLRSHPKTEERVRRIMELTPRGDLSAPLEGACRALAARSCRASAGRVFAPVAWGCGTDVAGIPAVAARAGPRYID